MRLADYRRQVDWACGILAGAALLWFLSGPLTPPASYGTIALSSPFLLERYGARFSEDYGQTWRVAGALRAAGHDDDARRLQDAWRRRVLKGLLGEPHPTPATVREAIAAERNSAESLVALHERARARVSVRPAGIVEDQLADLAQGRAQVTNGLAVPLVRLTLSLPLREGRDATFHCIPERRTAEEEALIATARGAARIADAKPVSRTVMPPPEYDERAKARAELRRALLARHGVAIAAGASAFVVCGEPRRDEREMLADSARTYAVFSFHSPMYLVSAGTSVLPVPIRGDDYNGRGYDDLRSAGCGELLVCAEARRRAWIELQRRFGQIAFLSVLSLGAYVGWRGTRDLRSRPDASATVVPRVVGAGAGVATAVLAAAGMLQFVVVFFALNPNVGLFPEVLWIPYSIAVVQVASAGILSAALLARRGERTRARAVLLALTPLLLATGFVLIFRCGMWSNLFWFSCVPPVR